MADVSEFNGGRLQWSVSSLAREFGRTRETVAKRLAQANVRPCGEKGGNAVYRLEDAAPVLANSLTSDGGFDPEQLRPMERRAWFQSEMARLQVEQELGRLILADEVHHEMSAMAKLVVRMLETLPDVVERDLRPGPDVIEYLHRKVSEVRAELAEQMRTESGYAGYA